MLSTMKPLRSLRFKLIGAAIIVEIVMLSLLVWNSMRLMEVNLQRQMEHRISELKPLLNASLAGPLLQYDLVTMKEIMQQYRTEEVLYYTVYNSIGEKMLSYGTPSLSSRLEPSTTITTAQDLLRDNILLIRMPITVIDQTVGALELELNTRFISLAISTARQQGLIIALSEIVLSMLLLSILGLALTRHLQDLISATKSMSDGNFSVRIAVKTQDEIGEAAKTFNKMADYVEKSQSELKTSEQQIRDLNEELEQRVDKRTLQLKLTNKQLQNSLSQLQQTQEQLVESEKMASLGNLVAGVAHEINTPIGVGVTAVSYLQTNVEKYNQLFEDGDLTQDDFNEFVESTTEATGIILTNLQRAANLVHSFKQVAVDQSTDERRQFNIKDYINEILQSLNPKLKKTSINIALNVPEDMVIYNTPGAFSQIITNLVMNSLIHAFDPSEQGEISITLNYTGDHEIQMIYADNGKGVPEENLKKVFEPFFTTNRQGGGSGLGMHIVYNLVTQKLGGKIQCQSEAGVGTEFVMLIPNIQEKINTELVS